MHINVPKTPPAGASKLRAANRIALTAEQGAVTQSPLFDRDVDFWRDIEKSTIKGAVSARNEAASRLQTLVTWLWGITTSGTLGGVAFKLVAGGNVPNPSLNISTILIALASALLVTTYWLCVRAQFPIDLNFVDPENADELKSIRDQFDNEMKSKNAWLHLALSFSALSTVTVSIALILHLMGM